MNDQTPGRPVGRRVILGTLGLGAAGVVFGAKAQHALDNMTAAVSQEDPTGLSALFPGGGGFRFYNVAGSIPHRDEQDYTLNVDGLVDGPATYSLADLRAMPQTTVVRDVQCVTGWRVPKVEFTGVLLRHLLDTAVVKPQGRALHFNCFDGVYTESLTLEEARRDDVVIAHEMNSAPLTAAHGGPVRLYVAPMYFYKSAKWLSGITVTEREHPGYWERYGYDVEAWVGRSNGRDDVPTS
ncbi:molybdopterin-dependent oxidoreductase [Streptomyces sp. NPDC005708]|uniref:molybdopterin-dependent oxidoreductase n=1 Tax=Streptomyces sp. NPDC005708 TaxID=3154564 RepID=UPI0033EFAD08